SLHFGDDVAFAQDVAGGGDFLHARHHYTLHVFLDAVHLTKLRGEVLHGHAELVARRLGRAGGRVALLLVAVQRAFRGLGRERPALPVTDGRDLYGRADRQVRDVVEQLAGGSDRAGVHVYHHVARHE